MHTDGENRLSPQPPGELVRAEIKRRGWTQDDLAKILGKPAPRINELIQGKLAITAEVAAALGAAFNTPADYWIYADAVYRLSQLNPETKEVRHRAKLYSIAPVKEMQKRGWIKMSESVEDLERELTRFYRLSSVDEDPTIRGAMRKTNPLTGATPAQRAWAFRVQQLAGVIPVNARYDDSKMESLKRDIRKLAAYSAEVKKVPALLSSYGIRYVVVEGLPGAKLDGFAFWLDEHSPVIGMSLKYDRLDSFWFTLGHELIHIQYRDEAPIDGDVSDYEDVPLHVKPPMERRADAEGAAIYIPPAELDSFIGRVGPLYTLERINQFANSIKMHPNVIIGQLKGRGEIPHSRFSKNNVPVRDAVIKAAVTDGWGKSIYPGAVA